jgi:ATP-binding protein involved in chromosome partitioning
MPRSGNLLGMAQAPASPPPAPAPLSGVRRVIAVGAGKGGVGKSTVAVNLALALQRGGARVGLMDGDVYGPSIPTMLGTHQRPSGSGPNHIEPIEAYGLKLMSMGFLLDPAKPMVVRGPIVHTVIRQFLGDVVWGDLDWLIVDLPPGTGDVALSLAQSAQVTGAVVVSTPQDVALVDVHRAVGMFRTLKVPVVGLVENMSWYECPSCHHRDEVFGHGGAKTWAAKERIPFLGGVPLHASVVSGGDAGRPALADPATPDNVRKAFFALADVLRATVETLEQQEPPPPLIQIEGLKR